MSLPETLPMGHHLLLAHARAYRAMKACGFDELQVGIAQQGSFFLPCKQPSGEYRGDADSNIRPAELQLVRLCVMVE